MNRTMLEDTTMMHEMEHSGVQEKFDSYPAELRKKLLFLRQLIFDTAAGTDEVGDLEETLKWGEPSYLVKGGSTIRIDWKRAAPKQYAMYFHCGTKLVDTFKELYQDQLEFEGNRAIVFQEDGNIAVDPLKHCISLALTYHGIKHLPNLGA